MVVSLYLNAKRGLRVDSSNNSPYQMISFGACEDRSSLKPTT